MTTNEDRLDKFQSLFEKDVGNDIDKSAEYAFFFNNLMAGITTEEAFKLLLQTYKDNPVEVLDELSTSLTAMFITGISTFRYALLQVKPELADAIREFEREYILGENENG